MVTTLIVVKVVLAILLALLLRTFVPYLIGAFAAWRDTLEWPGFKRDYWIPPLATFGISVLAFVGLVLTQPELAAGLAGGTFWSIVCGVYVLQDLTRHVQKGVQSRPKAYIQ